LYDSGGSADTWHTVAAAAGSVRFTRSGEVVVRIRTVRLVQALVAVLLALAVVGPAAPAQAAAPPVPHSMAALGDSITRGFNACGWYVDCPSRSWSTGSTTSVNSHLARLQRLGPVTAYNDAKTGAKMSALPGQAASAAAQGAQYVTVLLGANDACTSSESTMTPVSTFAAQVDSGLAALKAAPATPYVFIASIPDIKRLWAIGKDSSSARSTWALFGICQSMLANPRSTTTADTARRDRVQQRVRDYNAVLASACAAFGDHCRYDGGAVFGYPFTLSQVSTWDYFHPNTSGQTALAAVTWPTSYGW
jgi:lysophospholipase L1-like esterase